MKLSIRPLLWLLLLVAAGCSKPSDEEVRNVILLIGDGMGLSQIVAAMFANKNLTLMGLKNIGLQQNNALDAFTTDSAAGGSGLADELLRLHFALTES